MPASPCRSISGGSPPTPPPSSTRATTAAPSTTSRPGAQLILIGEDMVNAAYDSPVDFPPKEQIEEAETRLFALAETGQVRPGLPRLQHAR